MMIEIDFSSDEAIYIQLTNQIIMGIATSRLQEGDTLPSVRQLADTVGINMHTVNKIIGATGIIRRLPIIKQADKLGGVIVGLIEGLVVVWIFFTVVTAISGTENARSEERRVGKECLRLCRSRWSPYH